MALSLNEIKSRALAFGNNWQDERRERAEKDTFWNEFFEVFGVNRRRVATFEEPAKRFGNKRGGFIDVFWKGLLLCEHKSRGENLDGAFEQATDYFEGIKDNELPRYILVSDFARLRFYDLELKTNKEIKIQELASNLELFYFIAGYKTVTIREEEPVNIQAAELMGRLHDAIYDNGYRGHKLEILLTRILFILFSEDTGIFEKYQFHDLFLNRSGEDGSQAGQLINQLFEVLNTPNNERMKSLDESLNQFPYINGGLFEELIPTVSFDSESLKRLITCSKFDWSAISPAIFGSMFQFVMNKDRRREMGAHYTEEKNILKTINPLFLDDLKRDLETLKNYKIKSQRDKLLNDYQIKLASLIFLDPACGCGNFLIITYRELRRLELETLKAIHDTQAGLSIEYFSKVRVEQFYGIEFEEFPARIGMVAMWLMNHLMNLELSSAFGEYYARIPLAKSAGIAHANALEINWLEVLEGKKPDYIIGNPPFVGSRVQTKEQKVDLIRIFGKLKNSGDLDYVCCWYALASRVMQVFPETKTAFVSTNSITQGLQTSVLWDYLFKEYKLEIFFGHRTFKWSSQARGKAAVYCVIIGFGVFKPSQTTNLFVKKIYNYPDVKSEEVEQVVTNISPYLVEGNNLTIKARSKPICSVPEMSFGNMPNDSGNLLFTEIEKIEFIKIEPKSKDYFKPIISAKEFLNNEKRFCLWLQGIAPNELKQMPNVLKRVEQVKVFRENSTREAIRKLAFTPYLFGEIRQPKNGSFILIPNTTSENRKYIPIGFFDYTSVTTNSCSFIPNATLYHFGILTSKIHMAWVKYTCGRLKSDYRYSKDIVYNNFIWVEASIPTLPPKGVPPQEVGVVFERVSQLAQNVLDARLLYPTSSLADLYDPITMPVELVKAHNNLDKFVDSLYLDYAKNLGLVPTDSLINSDEDRMKILLELWRKVSG